MISFSLSSLSWNFRPSNPLILQVADNGTFWSPLSHEPIPIMNLLICILLLRYSGESWLTQWGCIRKWGSPHCIVKKPRPVHPMWIDGKRGHRMEDGEDVFQGHFFLPGDSFSLLHSREGRGLAQQVRIKRFQHYKHILRIKGNIPKVKKTVYSR